jgi:hypothetical protein
MLSSDLKISNLHRPMPSFREIWAMLFVLSSAISRKEPIP